MPADVTGVVQARMGSTRLPGKVLKRLGGRSVLGHVVERLRQAGVADRIVVATTTAPGDDPVVAEAKALGALVTRGSESDVLERFVQAFDEHGGAVGVRVTADCPVLDPAIVALAVESFRRRRPSVTYLSNTLDRTYPRGLDVEVFAVSALREAAAEAREPAEREHVTPFLYRRPGRYGVEQLTRADPAGTASWRLTLDTAEDWALLEEVFAALEGPHPRFGLPDIESLMAQRPHLLDINRHIAQKKL